VEDPSFRSSPRQRPTQRFKFSPFASKGRKKGRKKAEFNQKKGRAKKKAVLNPKRRNAWKLPPFSYKRRKKGYLQRIPLKRGGNSATIAPSLALFGERAEK
jgi:hypothetical protein